MPTLMSFTRPVQGDVDGNPLIAEALRLWIVSHTSLTITLVVINPTTIDVTGTIVVGDTGAIQTAINSYVYPTPTSPFIPTANMSNVNPMLDDNSKVVTSHAALTSDNAVLAVANSKTAVRFWDSGTFYNGTPNTGDMIIFTDNTTVSGGAGNATFYLTSDHTSAGSALCNTILQNSVRGGWIDPTANYNPGIATITGNKTIAINGSKQGNSGATILGIGVLTTITYPNQPDATVMTMFAIGISV